MNRIPLPILNLISIMDRITSIKNQYGRKIFRPSNPLFNAWTWRMAWRDSRTYRRRLLLFISCILLGVGGLVAVRALGDNLQRVVENEARTLLGADFARQQPARFCACG